MSALLSFGKTVCGRAVSLADNGARRTADPAMFHKAYSLEFSVRPIRRALPYANIRKAFSLLGSHARIGNVKRDEKCKE